MVLDNLLFYHTYFLDDGEFKKDKAERKGIIYYINGNKYLGEWKNGLKEEKGKFYWKNGNKYKGKNDILEQFIYEENIFTFLIVFYWVYL